MKQVKAAEATSSMFSIFGEIQLAVIGMIEDLKCLVHNRKSDLTLLLQNFIETSCFYCNMTE